jgi:hypothetical protein
MSFSHACAALRLVAASSQQSTMKNAKGELPLGEKQSP